MVAVASQVVSSIERKRIMKLTEALKAWVVEKCGVKSDASDDDFRKAAAEAIADGTLSPEKLHELTAEKAAPVNEFQKQFGELVGMVKGLATEVADLKKAPEKEAEKTTPTEEKAAPTGDTSWYEKVVTNVLAGGDPESHVRVKGAHEQYATTKSAAVYPPTQKGGKAHPLAGKPMVDFSEHGRTIDTPSELDKAVASAYAKLTIAAIRYKSRSTAFARMPQHDKELLLYAAQNMKWGGATDGGEEADIVNRCLTPREQKALIDDDPSGGLEAAPIVFDDMVIQAPLLNGELYPLVNVVPLDRGRRIEAIATAKVTGSWGGIDDTAITLFNTASYVSAFNTTVFRWEGAIKIGLDFMSETPIDFGAHITAQYGERLLEDLDDVIAAGNGTTQPEGVMTKSGTTSVAWGGATSIGNYESLRFGVTKAEHRPNVAATAVFCGTETSYQRARAIPVGASDARRIFGLDYSSYMLMERPYKINSTLTNSQVFYAIMGRYRMYRRRGLTFRSSTEGDTLMRANEMLILCTARFGGQLERGACAAVTTTAPA